jgi:hypothetical protein
MSDTEDYPGPTKGHPEKKGKLGQHPGPEDTDDETVKPPSTPPPEDGGKKGKGPVGRT